MRDFRQGDRQGGFDRGNRSGGGRFGGNGGFGGRGRFDQRRDFDRGPSQMHDATCSKCGKACQVPFRPTGAKPVFCSECFRSDGNDRPAPRNFDRPQSSGASAEQMSQINAKLDRILAVLQELEIDGGDEELAEESDDVTDDEEETA